MELEAISGAATVALASTVVFMLVAKTWLLLSRTLGAQPSFADRIMHEAAQRFRDELDNISSRQSAYLSGALVFATLFAAAYILQAKNLFSGYPSWQLYLQLGFLGLVMLYAGYCLIRTAFNRRQVAFVRDANIAIGHQLQQISAQGTRVFHDVSTTAGVVDHVIVSRRGVYAINVVARRSRQRASVESQQNHLHFQNGSEDESIVAIVAKSGRLQKELREVLGHKIRVRSVIAVPGWDVNEQGSDHHLLVNERNIGMITGWNDNSDHLMNEDVDLLNKELTTRCARG